MNFDSLRYLRVLPTSTDISNWEKQRRRCYRSCSKSSVHLSERDPVQFWLIVILRTVQTSFFTKFCSSQFAIFPFQITHLIPNFFGKTVHETIMARSWQEKWTTRPFGNLTKVPWFRNFFKHTGHESISVKITFSDSARILSSWRQGYKTFFDVNDAQEKASLYVFPCQASSVPNHKRFASKAGIYQGKLEDENTSQLAQSECERRGK